MIAKYQNRSTTMTESTKQALQLILFPDEFHLFQLQKKEVPPADIFQLPWYTISRTDDELSIVLPSSAIITQELSNRAKLSEIKEDPGWSCMKLDGVFDFSLVGILTEIVNPLKASKVPVFVVSTFNTDYVFVKEKTLKAARTALTEAGIEIVNSDKSVLSS